MTHLIDALEVARYRALMIDDPIARASLLRRLDNVIDFAGYLEDARQPITTVTSTGDAE